jgi:hypothetical protein
VFKITTRSETIEKRIIAALQAKVANDGYPKKIDKVAAELHDKLTGIIRAAVLSSNEFQSLTNGKLRADFGLDDNIVSILPGILVDLFEVYYEDAEVSNPKDIFSIRFVVRARSEDDPYMQSAYQRAHYTSKKSGEIIQWLRWLLFAGGDVINETYKVKLVDGKGRSGMAIMITGDNFSFKVDGEFSGTERSNMVSRAIDSVKDEMVSVIRSYTDVAK